LKKVDERKKMKELAQEMALTDLFDHKVKDLSGGELQRLAITAAVLKDADIYAFDEPSSYLDVKERLKIAKTLRQLADEGKSVLVIEHDLAVLDYLSDYVHILFGKESVYGMVSNVKSVRNGINEFLEGYIKDENIRFRGEEIKFEVKPPTEEMIMEEILAYPALEKKFEKFKLKTEAGNLRKGEVIGILGPNAIGKTTFVKMLAGVLKPDKGKVDWQATVSYKPQYIKPEKGVKVKELFARKNIDQEFYGAEIKRKLEIHMLEESDLDKLSGGELQRVSVAYALSQDADIYLLDEPSAFLDVEQRMHAADAIKNLAEKKGKVCMVVDHDILFQDYVSNRLMVFEGQSGKQGQAGQALSMRQGMNLFLKNLDITFRRDPQTGRPRANKAGSVKEQEQKQAGEYYYQQP
jgi:ATP-binding cassette subfamily E protein 1